jgi:hypothetical protein
MHVILPGPKSEWPATKIVLVTPAAGVPWERSRFPDSNVPAAWFDNGQPITFAVIFTGGNAYVQHLLYLKMLQLGLARGGDKPDPHVDDRDEMDHSKRDRWRQGCRRKRSPRRHGKEHHASVDAATPWAKA